jgi:hypothetical protein
MSHAERHSLRQEHAPELLVNRIHPGNYTLPVGFLLC